LYDVTTTAGRQKYNDPIQIPSGYVPAPQLRSSVAKKITPDHKMQPFTRPQAYVRLTPHSSDRRGGLRDLDQLDMVWLGLYNTKHPDAPLDTNTMEDMLFEFEQQAFNGAVREKSKMEEEGIEHRCDTACDVCGLMEGADGNEMVFCDGCDTCVHQHCYGVEQIPEGDWYCESCQVADDDHLMPEPTCVLCPVKGGALRETTKAGVFVHVGCALWIPEVTIPLHLETEPIDISVMPADRKRLLCCLCKTKDGACIQCQMPSCKTAFHVRCASQSKLRMDLMTKDEDDRGDIIRKAFCPRHRTYQEVSCSVVSSLSNQVAPETLAPKRLHGNRTEFCDLVSLPSVEAEVDSSMQVIQRVFAFWVQKRRKQERKPLFRQFVQRKSSKGERAPASSSRSGPAHKTLMSTRLSLERARSLCEMVRRRETKKRDLYRLMRREFASSVRSFATGLEVEVPPTITTTFWVGDDNDTNDSTGRAKSGSGRGRGRPPGSGRGSKKGSGGGSGGGGGGSSSSSSRRDGGGGAAAGRTPVRTNPRPPREPTQVELMQMAIDVMRKSISSGPFWFPVNKATAPDYYDIVKKPMELSTMQTKIKHGKYTDMAAFASDFDSICSNCILYNAKTSPVYQDMQVLHAIWESWKHEYLKEGTGNDAEGGGGGAVVEVPTASPTSSSFMSAVAGIGSAAIAAFAGLGASSPSVVTGAAVIGAAAFGF
jgi:uncharacterized membrane protein YgcG